MRKLIILLLCCGALVSMVGCGGNIAPPPMESPPTMVSETMISETVITETPPVAAVEPTEKEKEPTSTESKDMTTEPIVTTTEPPATVTEKPKEEPKSTATPKTTESSTAEKTEQKEETPPKTEEPQEEIYVGIQWPEVDPADIERLVIEKINAYRIAQGEAAATPLTKLMEVARYRANELTTNFSHTDIRDVCKELKYGEFVDMTLYGMTAEDSYYQGYNREAIGMGEWFGTAESMSDRIADGFHHSKGHWSYVGSSKYSYIAVGVTKANDKWYVCICMSKENYGG
mgnify:CR=1 FL=1